MNLIELNKIIEKLPTRKLKADLIRWAWTEISFSQNTELIHIAVLNKLPKLALQMRIQAQRLFELNERTNEVLIHHLEPLPDQSKDKIKQLQSNLY